MLKIEKDIYVVVSERDTGDPNQMNHGPMVFETFVPTATRERAERQIKNLKGKFGECRIAKLVFVDDPEVGGADDAQDTDTGNEARGYRGGQNRPDGHHKVVRRLPSRTGFRPDCGYQIDPISA
jgi:hypothetical protein